MEDAVRWLERTDIVVLPGKNPRTRRNAAADAALLQSIKQRKEELGEDKALIVPLLVSPSATRKGAYDLADGERRLDACAKAGLKRVKCLVQELSDTELYTLRLIDSLHNGDLHPLDQSDAYRKLQEEHGMGVQQIAALVSKPLDEVGRRLRLQALCEQARQMWEKGTIGFTVDHAELLAIHPAPVQLQALSSGDIVATKCRSGFDGKDTKVMCSVVELKEWLRKNAMLDLHTAGFPKNDAALVPEAGACTECPHRTGALEDLFGDLPKDRCLKKECFDKKVSAFRTLEATRAKEETGVAPIKISHNSYYSRHKNAVTADKWERTGKNAKDAVPAQIVEGNGVGKVIMVKLKTETDRKTAATKQTAAQLAKEKKEREKRYRQALYDEELVLALAARAPDSLAKVKREDLVLVLQVLFTDYTKDAERALRLVLGLKDDQDSFRVRWEKYPTAKLVQAILVQSVFSNFDKPSQQLRAGVAKRWKVNLKKVKAAAEKRWKEEKSGAATDENEWEN